MRKQPSPLDNIIPRDPAAAYRRKAIASRRVGKDAACEACGETRPEALIPNSKPITCAACDRKRKGATTMDDHHFAGESNSPVTVPTPVNDHRAELSVAQQNWPKETRENPDGCPLLAGAACVRGFIDYIVYLIRKGLLCVAEMLEAFSAYFKEKLGTKWWIGTPLEQFAPKR
jgi:hypothetical protein